MVRRTECSKGMYSIYEQESILWEQSAEGDSLSKGTTQDALSVFIVSDMFKHVKESLIK